MTTDRTVNERLGALEASQDELRTELAEFRKDVDQRFEQIDQRFDGTDGQIGGIHRSINALRNDIGQLKVGHALTGALRSTHRICLELGLEQTRVLDPGDLIRMFRGADTADIPNSERNSFLDADVIIEAVSDSGETHYVAVEASFTANGRDTRRAVRNADFLSRFTGQPARAAIAAAHIDNRLRELIDSGQVHWQQLKSVDLEVA